MVVPKSYKICPTIAFNTTRFGTQKYNLRPQLSLDGVAPPPETLIRLSQDKVIVEDFRSYLIEHERVVAQRGRLNEDRFTEFIKTGEILGYYSGQRQLLLLSGKKDDILDFCRNISNAHEISFNTISIDMKALLSRLAGVRLAWFRYDSSTIHASALAGEHIETTRPFKEANAIADISTLSFYVEDRVGVSHPVLVTSDGAVVLQATYEERSTEIELVLYVKNLLLDGIFVQVPFRHRRTAQSV